MTTKAHDRLFHTLIWAARSAIVLLMVSVAVIVDTASTERFRSDVRQEWQSRIDDLSLKLQGTILQNIQTVWGLAANVSVNPNIGEARFQELAAVIFGLAPELRNIGLAPDFVIRHIYPLKDNEAAIGLDLTSQSLSEEQINRLLETERAIFSGPIDLVQGGQGLAARIPIFETGSRDFWGVISVILDLPRLYEAVNLGSATTDGAIALSMSTDPEDSDGIFFGTRDANWKQPVQASLNMPGVTWTLFAQPRSGWPDHPEFPWLIRGTLILITLLATVVTFWLTRLLLKDRQMQQRFWGLFELAPIGIGLYNARSMTLLRANKSFKRIVGTGADSLDCFENAYDQNGNRLPKGFGVMEKLTDKVQFSGQEAYIQGPEGELRPLLLHGLKLLDTHDGKPIIWLIAEDITEQKKVDRMKSEFISTVSHELRTPLTSISGSLGLLVHDAAGKLPDKASHLANIAYRNSKQLTFLINDLLDIEKLIAGKMVFQMESHRVHDIVPECIENIENYAAEHSVSLQVGELADVLIQADRRRLSQALDNLLSNAIKFSPKGSEVWVFTRQSGQTVRICVQDRGNGIEPKFQAMIFQKFSQVDASDRRSRGGTGLGLAITRELMTRMGGNVAFESTPGEGSTFWLEVQASTGHTEWQERV
ncbi:multi-sensor signal transduction histidine kinase [Marinobacter lipolyticus SM19]|uniref:histidine kinase n=1 Tax=Marinobacter lipolyticus SM19 TaxID=1318628 RepID=R8B316_9GAMM|nr:ATP-binding protein [Marinobacter lipolyticus]EON92990.1 multi-sensor signal transduction histidine kinase [Marinobacter lipolyticus SM19]